MRFLADMGVDVRIVYWLRQQAHDATHLRDEGLHRLPDGEIFTKAIAENRAVLTFDLDFGELAALTRGAQGERRSFSARNTRTAHVIVRLAAVLAVFHRRQPCPFSPAARVAVFRAGVRHCGADRRRAVVVECSCESCFKANVASVLLLGFASPSPRPSPAVGRGVLLAKGAESER